MNREQSKAIKEWNAKVRREHQAIEDKIINCMMVLVAEVGDPNNIEHGYLKHLSYALKKNILADMKEALQ